VREGSSIALVCIAKCNNGTCNYAWTGAITSSTQNVTIPDVNRDIADAICTVTDANGEGTASFNINVFCRYSLRLLTMS